LQTSPVLSYAITVHTYVEELTTNEKTAQGLITLSFQKTMIHEACAAHLSI